MFVKVFFDSKIFCKRFCWWLQWKLKVFYKRVLQRNKKIKQYYKRKQMKKKSTNECWNERFSIVNRQTNKNQCWNTLLQKTFCKRNFRQTRKWRNLLKKCENFFQSAFNDLKKKTTTFWVLLIKTNCFVEK